VGIIKDLTGMVFGRLKVLKFSGVNEKTKCAEWICECICKKKTIVSGARLRNGKTKSCGCLKEGYRHGKSGDRLYNILMRMKARCYNPTDDAYELYGGRGIRICDEWLDKETGVICFYKWATENGYSEDLTIDRIDVNGNYEPNNCRWVTMKVQQNNKRNNVRIEINGEIKTMKQWSEVLGIDYIILQRRYNLGLRGEELLTHKSSVSGEKYIIWSSERQQWRVCIYNKEQKKTKYLGAFEDIEQAIRVRDEYIKNNFTNINI
jgi:hypothetical protein